MKLRLIYILSFVFFLSLTACKNGGSGEKLSNVEKGFMPVLTQGVEAYCKCMEPHERYVKDNPSKAGSDNFKYMKKTLLKKAQACIQEYDRDFTELQNLNSSLADADIKIFNNKFRKKFEATCPDGAKTIIGLWGNIAPLTEAKLKR